MARSCFSLLEGASQPEELVARAHELGLGALAITDRDGVYGLVRAWRAASERGLHLISGARLTVRGLPTMTLLVRNREGWGNLCRLITMGRAREPKGCSSLGLGELLRHAAGLHAIMYGPWPDEPMAQVREAFGGRACLGVSRSFLPGEQAWLGRMLQTSERTGVPLLAVGDVQMHHASRKPLLDVLCCIRRRTTIDRAGRALAPNGERVLRGPAETRRIFQDVGRRLGDERAFMDAVEHSAQVAAGCSFTLAELDYEYPSEVAAGQEPGARLRDLVREGLQGRYPAGAPPEVVRQAERELKIIMDLGYPSYFLTVHDVVEFARRRGILCQGRGSAANSVVCFAIGITAVDPTRSHLLFERFISRERGEPPDIDVDFEHERREEVIQYLYEKYGRHRAAMVNEVISWRLRSALRDVGKVMGLSLDQVDGMARLADRRSREGLGREDLVAAGVDPDDARVRLTLSLAGDLEGFPRHVGIHVGGFVLTRDQVVTRVPVEPASMEGRTVIQWDKDDIDAVGFVKVDLLSLGILTAIRKTFDLVASCPPSGGAPPGEGGEAAAGCWSGHPGSVPGGSQFTTPSHGGPVSHPRSWPHGLRWTLATVPPEDPRVYEMISRADTMGIFQVESRAQMAMLPRFRPRCFYDLVIAVSIVRPGPIQGGMVHPFLKRRQGQEPVSYAHPALEPILERTLGVPIFQEQVMSMAIEVAGFTPGQADQLRRAMGAWRKKGTLGPISEQLRRNLLERGISGDYAEQVVQQIQGFGEYGFPESHASSFALLVYVTAWLKLHYPAAFLAALLNSQPMGFYSPRSLVEDARRRGVRVLPVDVLTSGWDCSLEESPGEPGPAVRLGMRLVKGLGDDSAVAVVGARPFQSIPELVRRSGLDRGALSLLARANAFRGLGLTRREAQWQLEGSWQAPLFAGLARDDLDHPLPPLEPVEELESDHATTGLSLDAHPLGMMREDLTRRGVVPAEGLCGVEAGAVVRVAGLVACRQRPSTASGVVFLTLEDETGPVNVVVWPRLYERHRLVVRTATFLQVSGRLQREAESVSILASRVEALEGPPVKARSRDFH